MVGEKYLALKKYLLDKKLCSGQQLTCWMENAELIPTTKREGDGLVVCSVQYDAEFIFENFKAEPAEVFVYLVFWLNTNDDQRAEQNLPAPQFEIDNQGRGKVNVELSVKFREPVTLVEDDNGKFEYKGQKYRLDTPTLDIAETARVDGDKPHTRTA